MKRIICLIAFVSIALFVTKVNGSVEYMGAPLDFQAAVLSGGLVPQGLTVLTGPVVPTSFPMPTELNTPELQAGYNPETTIHGNFMQPVEAYNE